MFYALLNRMQVVYKHMNKFYDPMLVFQEDKFMGYRHMSNLICQKLVSKKGILVVYKHKHNWLGPMLAFPQGTLLACHKYTNMYLDQIKVYLLDTFFLRIYKCKLTDPMLELLQDMLLA